MFRYGLGSTLLFLLSAIVVCGVPAQQPPSKGNGSARSGNGSRAKPLSLPKNALIVIAENLEKAQAMLPDFILMSPKRFAEMQQRLQELEAKLQAKTQPIYKLELRGQVTGETVRLAAKYHVLVSGGERIGLGGAGGQIVSARSGDDVPIIAVTKEGFVWIVDEREQQDKTPRKATLEVEFEVPLTNQVAAKDGGSTSYRFTFGMPRSAISTLELTLPANTDSVVCNGQVRSTVRKGKQSHVGPIGLGSPKRLDVSWTSKRPRASLVRKDDFQWRFTLNILEHQFHLKGELEGRLPTGKQETLEIHLPKNASVVLPDEHKGSYDVNYDAATGVCRISTIQAGISARDFAVLVEVKGEWNDGSRFAIPSFHVSGQQADATIDVVVDRKVRGAYAWRYFPRSDWNRAEETGTKTVDARFVGRIPPYSPKAAASNSSRLLEVYLEPIQPIADMHIRHGVRLREVENRFVWLYEATIAVKPIHGRVRYIDVTMPDIRALRRHLQAWAACSRMALGADCIAGGLSPALLADRSVSPSHPVFQRWASDRDVRIQTEPLSEGKLRIYVDAGDPEFGLAQPFSLLYAATYHVDTSQREVWIPLVQVHTSRKAGEELTVSIEDSDWELALPRTENGERKVRLALHRASPLLALAWQPSVARLSFDVTTDVTLEPHRGLVRERWKCKSIPKDTRRSRLPVTLQVPRGIEDLLIERDGRHLAITSTGETASVSVAPGEDISLTYSFSYRHATSNSGDRRSRRLRIPFVRPTSYNDFRQRVHVWTQGGVLPRLALDAEENRSWRDLGTVALPGVDRLPAWAGEANRAAARLVLDVPSRSATSNDVLIDRGLLQVLCYSDGTEFWRVRYVLRSPESTRIRIGFPRTLDQLRPVIRINGKSASWQVAGNNDVAVIRLPEPITDASPVLDIRYTARSTLTSAVDLRLLIPPTVDEQSRSINGIRWQIITAAGSMPWIDGAYRPWPRKWVRHGWLFEKRTAATDRDMWSWIGSRDDELLSGGVILISGAAEPIRVLLLPREAWLLCGSGLFLFLAFLVVIPSRFRLIARALVVIGILPVMIAAVIFRPLWVDVALYAVQPGVLVFLLTMVAYWLIRRRARRKLERLPSFAPLQQISSSIRTTNPRRSPSTVDADRQVAESGLSSQASGASRE